MLAELDLAEAFLFLVARPKVGVPPVGVSGKMGSEKEGV